jgi:hypothetical protein
MKLKLFTLCIVKFRVFDHHQRKRKRIFKKNSKQTEVTQQKVNNVKKSTKEMRMKFGRKSEN